MHKVRGQSHGVLTYLWVSSGLRCTVVTSINLEVASQEVKERSWDEGQGKHLAKGRACWGCPDDQAVRFREGRESRAGTWQQETKQSDIWGQGH